VASVISESPSGAHVAAGRAVRKVVIATANPPDAVGGVERSCALLASVFEGRGAEVTIVWPRRQPSQWIYRVGLKPLMLSRQVGADPRLEQADLIVSNGIFGWGFPRSVQRIHVFHGTVARERLRRRWGDGVAETLAGGHATIVCVSDSTADEVARHYRLRTDAIVPNGIDLSVFAPRPRAQARAELGLPAGERIALFAGRLGPSKGAGIMEPACERAGYRLVIAGPNGTPGALHLGPLTPERLAVAYAAADCVLLPSLYEACSYVVLEALACCVPLLTTRLGYVPALLRAIPEYDALCLRPDEDDLAGRLQHLSQADTSALTARAHEWVVENNGLDRYAAQWDALLDSIGQTAVGVSCAAGSPR